MSKPRNRNAKPVSLSPLTPEDALAGLMRVKPVTEELREFFKTGDAVIISSEAKIAPNYAKGKRGEVVKAWERVRLPEEGDEKYFVYEVRLNGTDQTVEIEGCDLVPQ